eukprot:117724_1
MEWDPERDGISCPYSDLPNAGIPDTEDLHEAPDLYHALHRLHSIDVVSLESFGLFFRFGVSAEKPFRELGYTTQLILCTLAGVPTVGSLHRALARVPWADAPVFDVLGADDAFQANSSHEISYCFHEAKLQFALLRQTGLSNSEARDFLLSKNTPNRAVCQKFVDLGGLDLLFSRLDDSMSGALNIGGGIRSICPDWSMFLAMLNLFDEQIFPQTTDRKHPILQNGFWNGNLLDDSLAKTVARGNEIWKFLSRFVSEITDDTGRIEGGDRHARLLCKVFTVVSYILPHLYEEQWRIVDNRRLVSAIRHALTGSHFVSAEVMIAGISRKLFARTDAASTILDSSILPVAMDFALACGRNVRLRQETSSRSTKWSIWSCRHCEKIMRIFHGDQDTPRLRRGKPGRLYFLAFMGFVRELPTQIILASEVRAFESSFRTLLRGMGEFQAPHHMDNRGGHVLFLMRNFMGFRVNKLIEKEFEYYETEAFNTRIAYHTICCSRPNCLKTERNKTKKRFLRCSKCNRAWYCSITCQRAHWQGGHRAFCRKSAAAIRVSA